MKKILLLLFVLSAIKSTAQQKLSGNVVIENVLKAINDFQRGEQKRDSLLSHPLGSNQDEDFARRYKFYDSVYKQLGAIDTSSLVFDDHVNLELLQYTIGDQISSYKFKSYLN